MIFFYLNQSWNNFLFSYKMEINMSFSRVWPDFDSSAFFLQKQEVLTILKMCISILLIFSPIKTIILREVPQTNPYVKNGDQMYLTFTCVIYGGKNRPVRRKYFLMSQGSLNPKIRFLGQKICPVARSHFCFPYMSPESPCISKYRQYEVPRHVQESRHDSDRVSNIYPGVSKYVSKISIVCS